MKIRLTEEKLNRLVFECVRRVLNESETGIQSPKLYDIHVGTVTPLAFPKFSTILLGIFSCGTPMASANLFNINLLG